MTGAPVLSPAFRRLFSARLSVETKLKPPEGGTQNLLLLFLGVYFFPGLFRDLQIVPADSF